MLFYCCEVLFINDNITINNINNNINNINNINNNNIL